MKILSLLATLTVAAAGLQDTPDPFQPDAPVEQHRWLQQLAGEWSATIQVPAMGPGAEPMTMECTESIRAIGALWIHAEGSGTFNGTPVTSLMTLGYDPEKQAIVGTWIDSGHTDLWSYIGKLEGNVLTLEAEGPSWDDPAKTARYRDVIELHGRDKKTMTSSMQGADGSWTSFMTAEYRRTK